MTDYSLLKVKNLREKKMISRKKLCKNSGRKKKKKPIKTKEKEWIKNGKIIWRWTLFWLQDQEIKHVEERETM